MKSAVVASLGLVVALVLGGCSSSDGDRPAAEPAPTTAAATPASAGVISPADLEADPVFSNQAQGVIDDVSLKSCDTEPGDVTASGTATNSGKFTRDVAVVVSWVVGDTDDVVAKAVATVQDLAPGESADWAVETTVPGTTTASCVPTALAGQLKG